MSDMQLKIKVLEAHGLSQGDRNTSDPFVVAKFKGLGKMMNSVQTSIVHNSLNPVWNQELTLYPKTNTDVLLLKVYDHDVLTKDNLLGMVEIPLDRFFEKGTQDNWLQLMKRKGGWKSLVGGHPTWFGVPGQLHIHLWFGLSNQGTGLAQAQYVPQNVSTTQYSQPQTYGNQGFGTQQQTYPTQGTQGLGTQQQTYPTQGTQGLGNQGFGTQQGMQQAYSTQGTQQTYPTQGTQGLGTQGYGNQGFGTQQGMQQGMQKTVTTTTTSSTGPIGKDMGSAMFTTGFHPVSAPYQQQPLQTQF